jgi:hypothetical protein
MIMGWQICKVLKLVAISTLPPAQTRTLPQGEEDLQEGLRAYPSLMDGLNPPRAQQRSTVHGNVDSQSSRGPFWSDEAAKQTNLYQHSNDKQTSPYPVRLISKNLVPAKQCLSAASNANATAKCAAGTSLP